jgi:hypothetical protein
VAGQNIEYDDQTEEPDTTTAADEVAGEPDTTAAVEEHNQAEGGEANDVTEEPDTTASTSEGDDDVAGTETAEDDRGQDTEESNDTDEYSDEWVYHRLPLGWGDGYSSPYATAGRKRRLEGAPRNHI